MLRMKNSMPPGVVSLPKQACISEALRQKILQALPISLLPKVFALCNEGSVGVVEVRSTLLSISPTSGTNVQVFHVLAVVHGILDQLHILLDSPQLVLQGRDGQIAAKGPDGLYGAVR